MPECRVCGKEIVFATPVDEQGAPRTKKDGTPIKVPLERCAHIYTLFESPTGQHEAKQERGFYVSHFLTCTDPSRFSKKGR